MDRDGAFSQWTYAVRKRAHQLRAKDPPYSLSDVATVLRAEFDIDVRDYDVRAWWKAVKRGSKLAIVSQQTIQENSPKVGFAAGESKPTYIVPPAPTLRPLLEKYGALIEESPAKNSREAARRSLETGTKKIGVLSDIHLPYHRADLIEEFIRRHPDLDAVVCNGDVCNWDSVSHHLSYEAERPEDDAEALLWLNERLTTAYPGKPIFQLTGNHDLRVPKRVAETMDPFLARTIVRSFNETMARPFPDVHALPRPYWWYRIGRAVFSHGEKRVGSTSWRRNSELFLEYFVKHAYRHGIEPPDVITQGHQHALGCQKLGSGWVYWAGTLAKEQDYSQGPDMYDPRGHQNGYCVIVLDNGRFVPNRSRCFDFSDLSFGSGRGL